MVPQESLLALLVRLIDQIPMPAPPKKRGRGRPRIYTDRLFLKALVIMIVQRLHQVHELLSVLEQPTTQMQTLRASLMQNGRYPTRKTFDRRLAALPQTLPAQIGCLGRHAGGADTAVAALRSGSSHGQHGTSSQRWSALAQEGQRQRCCAAQSHRYRGGLDEIRLARVGIRLETAYRFGSSRCLDSSCGSTDGCQHR